MEKGGTEDQRKRSDLWSRIEKIKKMDPNLEYTAAELQERRRKRLGGVTVSQLQSLAQPQIIPREDSRISDLLRRDPGVFTYKLNTEYYLNSIALAKVSRTVKNQPSQGDFQSPVHVREDEPMKKSSPRQEVNSDVDNEGILPVQNECIKLKPVNEEEKPIEELIEAEERKEVQPKKNIFVQLTSKCQEINELAQEKRAEMAAIFRKKSPEPEKSENQAKPQIKPLFGLQGFEKSQKAPIFGGLGIFDKKPIQQPSNAIPSSSNEAPSEKKETSTQPHLGGISLFAKQGQKKQTSGLLTQQKQTSGLFTQQKQTSGLFTQQIKQSSTGLFGASTTTIPGLFGQSASSDSFKLFSPPGLFNSTITPSGPAASSELFSKVPTQPVQEVVASGIFSQGASSRSIFSVIAKEPSQKIQESNCEAVKTNPFGKKMIPDKNMQGQPNKQDDSTEQKPIDNIFTRPREENRSISLKVEKDPLLTQQSKPSLFSQSTSLFTDNQISKKKSSQESQKEAAQESPKVIVAQRPDSEIEIASPSKKKNEAIGPGGKKIDLPEAGSFFAGQNKSNTIFTGPTNIFGEPTQKSSGSSLTANLPSSNDKAPVGFLGQSGTNSSSFGQNYFNKAASGGGIFGGQAGTSLFGGQSGNSIVGGSSTIGQTIFGGKSSGGSLFGGMQPAIFSQGGTDFTTPKEEDEEDKQEENDDDLVEAEEEEIDPTKSTGNYNYVQSNVLFKDTALKFRHGSKDTLQNVTISLERFEDNSPAHLFVRLANKCVAFNGTVMSGGTQARTLNNSSKNLEISKLVISENNIYSFARVKVQLKDENIGAKLMEELEKLLKG